MDSAAQFINAQTSSLVSIGAAVAVVGLTVVWRLTRRPKLVNGRVSMKPKDNSDEVVIYAFARWANGPSPSPGCLKLETFCRLARIPYRYDMDASKSGPTGRWPYLSHRGEYISDSNTCIEYLVKSIQSASGDDGLTAKDKALGDIIVKMLDQGCYFNLLRYRWVDNFPTLKGVFRFPGVPDIVKSYLMKGFRVDILKVLNGQGCGDRSDSEYLQDLLKDIKALEQWMPLDGCFFANSKRPTKYDATLYAFLHNFAAFNPEATGGPAPAEFVTYIQKSARIQTYLQTVEQEAFPDIKTICNDTENRMLYETVEKIRQSKQN